MKPFLKQHRYPLLFLLATWGVYLSVLFGRMIRLTPDGLLVGHENVWSDWALHIALANIFALKSPHDWFVYHPMYAAGKLTYPFMVNLISGLLMRAGVSLPLAIIVPSIILVLLLLVGMYYFFWLLLKSSKQAVVAISLFFLSSGPGFVIWVKDLWQHPSWSLIAFPPQQYSRIESLQWLTGNVITGMLLPQRAFLLGMTIAVWILATYVWFLQQVKFTQRTKWLLVIAGLGAGLLPITHPHSFIVVVLLTGLLSLVYGQRWRQWLWFAIPAAILSIKLYWFFLHGGIQDPHFLSFAPGWTNQGTIVSWVWQWWRQWGAMLPVAIGATVLFWRLWSPIERTIYSGFAVLFLASNLFLFQPTAWDNSKLFFWVYFGLCALAAQVLAWLWRHGITWKIMAVVLAIALTGTGWLEMIRLARVDQHTFVLSSAEDMQLGDLIRQKTGPRDVFLTDMIHNHPVTMWGVRPIVMGYPGWVSNYGFLSSQTETDVRAMFLGGDLTPELLNKHNVSYVVIGPQEIADLQANEGWFADRYPLAFQTEHYHVYKVR